MIRYRLIKLSLVLALVAASCGDGDGDDEAATDRADTDDASVTENDDAGHQEDEPTTAADEPADDDGDVELTATERGVSAEAIKVGVLFPDLSNLGIDNGDLEAKFRIPIDDLNAAGGINGRTVDLVFEGVDPLDDLAFDEKCTAITQDEEVFAVLGVFLRDQVLCLTDINETIAVTHFEATEDHFDRSKAPLVTVAPRAVRLVDINVGALVDGGVLSAGDSIAIHGQDNAIELHERYRVALENAGISIVSDTIMTEGTDLAATRADMEIFASKWESDGATAVLATFNAAAGAVFAGVESAGVDMPVLLPNGLDRPPTVLQSAFGIDASFDQGVVLIADAGAVPQWADDVNGVRECAARFEEVSGETIYTTETGEEPLENLGPTMVACELVELFTAIATEAGVNLTDESFAAAMESIGSFSITGVAEGSLGPGKPDYGDSPPAIAEFNRGNYAFEAA